MQFLLKQFDFTQSTKNYFQKQSEKKKTSLNKFFTKLLEKADIDLVVYEYGLDIGRIEHLRNIDAEFDKCIGQIEDKGKRLKAKLALDHLYQMSFKDPKLLLTFLKHMRVIDEEAQDLQAAKQNNIEEKEAKQSFGITLEDFSNAKE